MQRADAHDRPPSLQPPPPKATLQQPAKALRFVTNYGAPHPKRRRIGAACLTCRKRKTACSGERPFCETCKQNRLECAGYSTTDTPAAPSNKRTTADTPARETSEQRTSHAKTPSSPNTGARHNNAHDLTRSRSLSGRQSPDHAVNGGSHPVDSSTHAEHSRDSLFSGPQNRMPYFRWLGPTAIMPGFKQMVVKVKRQDTDAARSSTDGSGVRSPSLNNAQSVEQRNASIYSNTPVAVESDMRTQLNLPFYDTSPMPPSELITHLANTFFTHLGCNYPFLRQQHFMKDLEEKQVDAILVDAVCALAARFSTHPLLIQAASDGETKASPAEFGHAFAQRAKTALIDTFPCPTVAAAQAALLLAYNEFGEQRDSGLWMYLGISIRLAQDLGLHKLEGLRYVGRDGPTPKEVKRQSKLNYKIDGSAHHGHANGKAEPASQNISHLREPSANDQTPVEDSSAVEQERVDTFWAIFFLDRMISSGTGRRATLRDKDIEISFPSMNQPDSDSHWPAPFPALIRIVHMYGRVADLLNSIKEPSDITTDTPRRLAAMESQVTRFYQGLSPKLHFDAVNFQHYMRAGEGTNFVLLHFWFHTLIIMLHQPTLLKTFEGRMLQLFPNSQQLAMSSAKTIADILAYSQLMDAKASLGNPFTTQPIYIAACAFLRETVEQTATSKEQSRANSPSRNKDANRDPTSDSASTPSTTDAAERPLRKGSISTIAIDHLATGGKPDEKRGQDPKTTIAKHTLLATAASQHYGLCYKALQSLETYWAGTKYILTVLDQKFEGVGDPLLYTAEEGDASMEQPRPEPAFTSPGWRRKFSWGPYNANSESLPSPFWPPKGFSPVPGSPGGVDSSKAIGWTLTGGMNSSSTNLAWHYASGQSPNIDPRLSSHTPLEAPTGIASNVQLPKHLRSGSSSAQRLAASDSLQRQTSHEYRPTVSNAEPKSTVRMNSPYSQQGSAHSSAMSSTYQGQQPSLHPHAHGATALTSGTATMAGDVRTLFTPNAFSTGPGTEYPMHFMGGDMMIESQNIDMSVLGLDMMPWFDSFPTHDMMAMFDPNQASGGAANHGDGAAGQR